MTSLFLTIVCFVLLAGQTAAVECDCYSMTGTCLDTTQWGSLCNLSTVNYVVLGIMTAVAILALAIDHALYKHIDN